MKRTLTDGTIDEITIVEIRLDKGRDGNPDRLFVAKECTSGKGWVDTSYGVCTLDQLEHPDCRDRYSFAGPIELPPELVAIKKAKYFHGDPEVMVFNHWHYDVWDETGKVKRCSLLSATHVYELLRNRKGHLPSYVTPAQDLWPTYPQARGGERPLPTWTGAQFEVAYLIANPNY